MKTKKNIDIRFSREVVILDTSEIEDFVDYGGLLYKLKKLKVQDGKEYQIDNSGNLLMYRNAYQNCKRILEEFGAEAV